MSAFLCTDADGGGFGDGKKQERFRMTKKSGPPYRADHVGSLLRPAALLDVRARFARQQIDAAALREAENAAIRDAVALQESAGLRAITDGEFRRTYFHIDFLEQIGGMEAVMTGMAAHFHREGGDLDFAPPKLHTKGRLKRMKPIMGDDFEFLKSVVTTTPKVTIPSPSMAHFRGGRGAVDTTAYPDMAAFFEDLTSVYREEVNDLAARGCRYLQFDDTNLAYLCDSKMRESARAMGEDPDALPALYAGLINAALRDRPRDMHTAVHLCRGNFRSAWVAEGGYDPVAEVLFGQIDVDAFLLEYDTDRAGDFAPLRYVPEGKTVVLGLVSSKKPQLESKDDLKCRIDSAAKHVPLERLAISPQCGFSSTVHGNEITADVQRRKLELVVETAREVWGSA
jgi:5-methyltetrahydropteroyltriglutamate--homocysteine methyltransferase